MLLFSHVMVLFSHVMLLFSHVMAPAQPTCRQLATRYKLDPIATACFIHGAPSWPPKPGHTNGTYSVPRNQTAVLQGEISGGPSSLGVRVNVISANLLARHVEMSMKKAVPQPTYFHYALGGAIFVQHGQLRVESSIFHNNIAPGFGGGAIFVRQGSGVWIQDCVFSANQALDAGIGHDSSDRTAGSNSIGGAVAVDGISDRVHVSGSSFSNNVAGWYGAAVYVLDGASVVVNDTIFTGNTLTHPPDGDDTKSSGAAISVWGATANLVVTACTFERNVASVASAVWMRTGREFGYFVVSGCRGWDGDAMTGLATTAVAWDGHGANPDHINVVQDGQLTLPELLTGAATRWMYISVVPQASRCRFLHPPAQTTGNRSVSDNSSEAVACRTNLFGEAAARCQHGR